MAIRIENESEIWMDVGPPINDSDLLAKVIGLKLHHADVAFRNHYRPTVKNKIFYLLNGWLCVELDNNIATLFYIDTIDLTSIGEERGDIWTSL